MYKLFNYLQRIKVGFLKRNFKENQGISKNHGSFVIKEIFKKEGILKPGNFFKNTYNPKNFLKNPTFKNNIINVK